LHARDASVEILQASKTGAIETIRQLIADAGSKVDELLDTRDLHGNSPLHWACYQRPTIRHTMVVQVLLEHGGMCMVALELELRLGLQ
jgi:ankyrin repeat protein